MTFESFIHFSYILYFILWSKQTIDTYSWIILFDVLLGFQLTVYTDWDLLATLLGFTERDFKNSVEIVTTFFYCWRYHLCYVFSMELYVRNLFQDKISRTHFTSSKELAYFFTLEQRKLGNFSNLPLCWYSENLVANKLSFSYSSFLVPDALYSYVFGLDFTCSSFLWSKFKECIFLLWIIQKISRSEIRYILITTTTKRINKPCLREHCTV